DYVINHFELPAEAIRPLAANSLPPGILPLNQNISTGLASLICPGEVSIENCNQTTAQATIGASTDAKPLTSFDEIPKVVQEAIVDREDATFWEHNGIPLKSSIAALIK